MLEAKARVAKHARSATMLADFPVIPASREERICPHQSGNNLMQPAIGGLGRGHSTKAGDDVADIALPGSKPFLGFLGGQQPEQHIALFLRGRTPVVVPFNGRLIPGDDIAIEVARVNRILETLYRAHQERYQFIAGQVSDDGIWRYDLAIGQDVGVPALVFGELQDPRDAVQYGRRDIPGASLL
jgi:hypothetical protein